MNMKAHEITLNLSSPTGSGCREWLRGKTAAGYGQVHFNGKNMRAHRVVFELVAGPIPPGTFICHTCDNPPCCEISHLFIGTVLDNARDREHKGRGHQATRDAHGSAKLTTPIANEIRRLYATKQYFQRELGTLYGVDQSVISDLVNNKIWKS